MVQVESMTCGTPVVASDLPGVRQPVGMTGMGLIVPPQDPASLAQALIQILDQPGRFQGDRNAVARSFAPDAIATEYEALYTGLIEKNPAPHHSRAPASRERIGPD
jgi:glycosyltransferase involved in cell wall biosynthesis